jgi:hypothetical protein
VSTESRIARLRWTRESVPAEAFPWKRLLLSRHALRFASDATSRHGRISLLSRRDVAYSLAALAITTNQPPP